MTIPTNKSISEVTYNGVNIPLQVNLQNKSITISQNGSQTFYPDTGYAGLSSMAVTTNVATANPVTVATKAEMNALLIPGNVGKVYKYVGTTGTYQQNSYYVVENN